MSKRNLLCFMLFILAMILFVPPVLANGEESTVNHETWLRQKLAAGVVPELNSSDVVIKLNSPLVISKSVTFNGGGLTLDGQGKTRVLLVSADNNTVTIENLTIQSGSVKYPLATVSSDEFGGAGIYIFNTAKVTVKNVVFKDNEVFNGTSIDNWNEEAGNAVDYASGGGIEILASKKEVSVDVISCDFIRNGAECQGGGISAQSGFGYKLTLKVQSCDFSYNKAMRFYGGAIFAGEQYFLYKSDRNKAPSKVDITIDGCTFTSNEAWWYGYGGAIANMAVSYPSSDLKIKVKNSTFDNNAASNWGGAILNWTLQTNTKLAFEADNCIFRNNSALSSGGAIWSGTDLLSSGIQPGSLLLSSKVTNCTFENNKTGQVLRPSTNQTYSRDAYTNANGTETAATGLGGAMFVWACSGCVSSDIQNCVFRGNSAKDFGGAVAHEAYYQNNISSDIRDCTFENNEAQIGGGIINYAWRFFDNKSADNHITQTVTNSTFIGNKASRYGGGMANKTGAGTYNAKGQQHNIIDQTVVNCTFVNNKASDDNCGHEAYNVAVSQDSLTSASASSIGMNASKKYGSAYGTINAKLINTILYNSTSSAAVLGRTTAAGKVSFDLTNCAFSGTIPADIAATSKDSTASITLSNTTSASVKVEGVTHSVVLLTSKDTALTRGGTSGDKTGYKIPVLDVRRFTRSKTNPSLGAAEYIGVAIVSPDKVSMDAEEYAFFSVGIKAKVEPEQGDSTTLTITIESADLTSYGLSFDADTGTLSGKLLKAGTATFTVKAVSGNDAGTSASKTFTLTVTKATLKKISADFGGSDQMTLTLTEGETASLDLTKKLVISGDFGNGVTALKLESCDITWSGISGVAGITFANGSVDVAGTAKAGKYSFDVTATVSMDNKTAEAKVKVAVTINEKLYAPKLSASGTSGDVKKGSTVNITVTATSADKVLWTGTGNIPTGTSLTSDDKTLTITGTATATGAYTYTITAKNAKSADLSASTAITFRVSNTTAEAPVKAQPGAISTTRDAETGNTVISRTTVFTTDGSDNGDGTTGTGTVILSTDIAITIESTDLKASADEEFSRTVSVDVTFRIVETSYKNYVYSLDITGYPAWLKVSGDVKSTDKALTNGKRTHVFRIYGTPTSKDATNAPAPFSLIANVTISNDHNVLNASADCDVKIYVASKDNPLTSIAVEITGEQTITLNFDSADAKSYDVVVTGTYADASQAVLSADDYTVAWTHGTLSAGITFSNNTLSVAANTSPDTYTVVLTATVTAGSLTKSADKTVTITVNAKPAPAEVTPVLSGDNLTQTVNKGSAITDITITAVSGDNITWSASGTLPDGLAVSSGDKTFTISGTVADSAAIQAYTYTVTATNSAGSASVEAAITVTGSSSSNPDDDITPEHGEIQTTTDAATGNTIISRKSVFSNSNGIPVLSTDIVITIEALEFTASVDETFSKTVSVDVTLEIAGDSYKNYFYSMDVTGKPAWLNVEGELESFDKALTAGKKIHVFRIYGTPASSDAASNPDPISLIANVTISNDYNVLNASADCNVKIYVASKDEEPETVTLTSIDVEIAGVSEITLNFGSADAQQYTAIVSGDYGSGWTALNAGSYDVTWSTGTLADGITFTDKTLSVSAATATGEYTVEITATVTAEGLTKSAVKTVKITVNEASSPASVDVKPVLSGTNLTQTVEKGKAITAITITATSGDNLTWTASGTLPEGLAVSSGDKTCTISGTVADSAAIQVYTYTVAASNTAGSAEITVRITVTRTVTPDAAPTSPDVTPTSQDVTPTSTDVIPTPSNPDAEVIIMDTGDVIAVDNSGNLEVLVSQTGNLADILTQMSDAEKSTITSIKINDSITDLSGLNDLTNLEQLDLKEATSLENVDLRGNTSIKTLEVTGNSAIKNLTLAGSGVKTVEADSCEGLEEVDVEGCEELEYLNVSNTGTTVLNARNCANLQVLACGSCAITQLNLEGCLSLRDLDCIGNALLRLDAYLFPVLESLNCSDQKRSGWTPSRRMSFGVFLNSMTVSAADAGDGTESGEEDNSYLANVDNLKAFDSAGNEIGVTYDKETGEAEFAQTPASFSYEYITGFNGIRMDVTIASDGSQSGTDETGTDETSHVVGNPGGGCNAGFGAAAILMALAAVLGKKRKA